MSSSQAPRLLYRSHLGIFLNPAHPFSRPFIVFCSIGHEPVDTGAGRHGLTVSEGLKRPRTTHLALCARVDSGIRGKTKQLDRSTLYLLQQ